MPKYLTLFFLTFIPLIIFGQEELTWKEPKPEIFELRNNDLNLRGIPDPPAVPIENYSPILLIAGLLALKKAHARQVSELQKECKQLP